MTAALAYWILMLIWFVSNAAVSWQQGSFYFGNVLIFLLFLLLGWHVFGAPLK